MVDAGQISIGGDIDTRGIETGLGRIRKGFDAIVVAGKSVNSDFVRMNQQTDRLQRNLKILAVTGTGALLGLAKGAPAVAGSMAKIGVSMLKLKMSVGEALSPLAELVSEKLQGLANWVEAHPDLFSKITTSVLLLSGALAAFKIGGAFVGLIAFLASPPVLIAVATITALAAAILSINTYLEKAKKIGTEGTIFDKIKFIATEGPLGQIPGVDDWLMSIIRNYFAKRSRKNQAYDPEDLI